RYQNAAELDLQRRGSVADERRGAVAIDLYAEGITAEALLAAVVDPAGLRLARPPAVDDRLRPAGGKDPEPAPAADQRQHHHHQRQIAAAGAAARLNAGRMQDHGG